jgi:hypothetical protein
MITIDDIKWDVKDLLPKLSVLLDKVDGLRGDADDARDELRDDDESMFHGVNDDYVEMDSTANCLQSAFEHLDEAYGELLAVANARARR